MAEREAESTDRTVTIEIIYDDDAALSSALGSLHLRSRRDGIRTATGGGWHATVKAGAAETDALRAALERGAIALDALVKRLELGGGCHLCAYEPPHANNHEPHCEIDAAEWALRAMRMALAGAMPAPGDPACDALADAPIPLATIRDIEADAYRRAAAVAREYEQKCEAEAARHDWRKTDTTGNHDAMRIKEAWDERVEAALAIREEIEALAAAPESREAGAGG